jgi:hypothetical protein
LTLWTKTSCRNVFPISAKAPNSKPTQQVATKRPSNIPCVGARKLFSKLIPLYSKRIGPEGKQMWNKREKEKEKSSIPAIREFWPSLLLVPSLPFLVVLNRYP